MGHSTSDFDCIPLKRYTQTEVKFPLSFFSEFTFLAAVKQFYLQEIPGLFCLLLFLFFYGDILVITTSLNCAQIQEDLQGFKVYL